jgi:hypothetical protein
MDPEVPLIESVYVPAVKNEPLMVRVTVPGKALTVTGLMLQLPAP